MKNLKIKTLSDLARIGVSVDGPTVELSPYEFNYGVVINKNISTELNAMGMVVGLPGKGACFLILPDNRPDLATLMHEVMHVLDELETYIQDRLEREARAFIVQRIVEETLKFLGVIK